ncbi:hypothetical protein NUW58_g1245 [Xylaria curta]|uniref:Uncharacterized protein n=1 Tax=Xylaria curta TaxID=42375 RepID=A0ACC1PMV8_9PEZI|nr:hypothetical protein NUW58_g1245 [Xylaria curta]
MPQSTNPSGASNEVIVPTTVSYDETNGAKSTSTPTVQETTSARQNAWLWQGGPPSWTPGAGPWSGPWGGSPTTVITVTTTVGYTQPSSTTTVFQPSSSGPAAPETRKDGVNISAPVVAGIGAGAGIGLLGIGVLVAYLFTRRSNRRRRQSSSRQASSNVGSTSDPHLAAISFFGIKRIASRAYGNTGTSRDVR